VQRKKVFSLRSRQEWQRQGRGDSRNNGDSWNSHELGNQNTSSTLSVVAMMAISPTQTLNVYGYVKKTKVKLLINSVSSHKFIDMNIVMKLNIFIYPTSEFQVSIPGNRTTSCDRRCQNVEVSMNVYKLKSLM